MISFIIPAHNEQAWIGRCIAAIRKSVETIGEPHEIIVVNDASTDATAALAAAEGARVISVAHRQISATRNAGARQATGEVFFFVDADTLVNGPVVHSALAAMRAGAVGGGCVPEFEGRIPWWSRVAYPLGVAIVRLTSLSGGACQFCTRQAFERVGGFSEKHFAAEDAFFMRELKRHGRVVVPKERILTSGRSLRNHSLGKIARLLTRLALRGPGGLRQREGLDVWYQPKREDVGEGEVRKT